MPDKPNAITFQLAKLMQYAWFRELVMKTSNAPENISYRETIPSDVADGRKALVLGTKNASLYVSDLDRSRKFYETSVGLKHLKTGDPVDHPYVKGRKVQVCAMGFGKTPDLMLVRQTDDQGNLIPVTENGLHHLAFWIESSTDIKDFAKELKRKGIELSYGPIKHYPGPGGDGGWGGNCAVYAHDPDGHFIEYHNDMDPYGTQYEIRGIRG